ncbi:hypothetical protein Q8W71_22905 [Methylobacterium sp. NEAU 140]|uniref:hypothetical protein n=1 Tax=Methylobacterium sp. NEAU 140 TaxID=3064945 RepID=UPI002737786F|nr:hypothetical protein [Methylobacterium sp. NEAU 140]MDP4025487.1 hypothetical protein [Methylobacterium sp. NEAU 140]
MRRGLRTAAALALLAGPAGAADLDGPSGYGPGPGGAPRFFPRGDGSERRSRVGALPRPLPVGCIPRRAPVPTNAPDDPSYVGSAYGLGHPSYYGFTPPLGVDDPFGRSLLPYCP